MTLCIYIYDGLGYTETVLGPRENICTYIYIYIHIHKVHILMALSDSFLDSARVSGLNRKDDVVMKFDDAF